MNMSEEWLPECFKTATRTETHLTGFVSSEEELQLVLECHSRAFSTTFSKWCEDINKKSRLKSKRRLLWKSEDFPGNVPIVINNRSIYTCQYGRKYCTRNTKNTDPGKPKRLRKSKKVDCPAKLSVRHITRYDKFRVNEKGSRHERENAMSLLEVHIKKGGERGSPTIHIKLPLPPAHQNHPISIKNEFIRNVHPAVRIQFRESMASPTVKAPVLPYFVGVDCGTSSVRAALVSSNGIVVKTDVEPIKIWNPKEDFYEQSSEDIWKACCKVVKSVCSSVPNDEIHGVGFDATCSLVVLDEDFKPVSVAELGEDERNIIMWMDHRAKSQTEVINETQHAVLKFVGGTMSVEMQPPKLLWLKENLSEERWKKAAHFFDLADFLTWKATGSLSRSLCTLVCKWTFQAQDDQLKWDDTFWRQIGLLDLTEEDHGKIGNIVQFPGQPVGEGLTEESAEAFGLKDGTAVATSLIDAHAGGVGMLGADVTENDLPCEKKPITHRLALVLGTSSCHMAISQGPLLVPGVWGPYFSAMIPGLWLNEGGQSITGKLIDHMIETHPSYQELKQTAQARSQSIYDCLLNILGKIVKERGIKDAALLTKDLHIWPDFHGNRSPLADPTSKGMISGLTLGTSLTNLAVLYIATIQALALGTKHVLEIMSSAGHSINTLFACGGLSKNALFLQVHADVIGLPLAIPQEKESVLVGSAILGACAAGYYENMQDAMETMSHIGGVIRPSRKLTDFYKRKYKVFRLMFDHQMEYRRIMDS